MSDNGEQQKTYHKKATGNALVTIWELFLVSQSYPFPGGPEGGVRWRQVLLNTIANTSAGSPFVQRVWIALEVKGLFYQYIEVDPYKKPQALLEVNPRGLVPAFRHGDWGCGESTVLMEYVIAYWSMQYTVYS
jgi:hypothetical protein